MLLYNNLICKKKCINHHGIFRSIVFQVALFAILTFYFEKIGHSRENIDAIHRKWDSSSEIKAYRTIYDEISLIKKSENIKINNPEKSDLNLNNSVNQAIAINPAVKSAAAKLRKSLIDIKIEKNSYYPSIQTSFGSSRLKNPQLNYEVSITQMLYDWGAVESRVHSAQAAERLSAQELLIARENSAIEIIELYYDLLLSNQRTQAIDAFTQRLDALFDLSAKRVDAAYSDRSEKTRVALEIAKAKEQGLLENSKVLELRKKYQILTGNLPIPNRAPQQPSLRQLLADGKNLPYLVQSSPLYLQSIEKKNMEEASLRTADAVLKPQLNLEGSTVRREIGGLPTRDSTISIQFRMPLTQGFANFQRRDAIRESIEAANWDIEATTRDITLKVLMLMETEVPIQARIAALQEQINSSDELTQLYQEQFLIGLRSMSDLLTVALNWYEAQCQLIEVRSEQQRLTYRAMSQLGLLIPMLEERIHQKLPV